MALSEEEKELIEKIIKLVFQRKTAKFQELKVPGNLAELVGKWAEDQHPFRLDGIVLYSFCLISQKNVELLLKDVKVAADNLQAIEAIFKSSISDLCTEIPKLTEVVRDEMTLVRFTAEKAKITICDVPATQWGLGAEELLVGDDLEESTDEQMDLLRLFIETDGRCRLKDDDEEPRYISRHPSPELENLCVASPANMVPSPISLHIQSCSSSLWGLSVNTNPSSIATTTYPVSPNDMVFVYGSGAHGAPEVILDDVAGFQAMGEIRADEEDSGAILEGPGADFQNSEDIEVSEAVKDDSGAVFEDFGAAEKSEDVREDSGAVFDDSGDVEVPEAVQEGSRDVLEDSGDVEHPEVVQKFELERIQPGEPMELELDEIHHFNPLLTSTPKKRCTKATEHSPIPEKKPRMLMIKLESTADAKLRKEIKRLHNLNRREAISNRFLKKIHLESPIFKFLKEIGKKSERKNEEVTCDTERFENPVFDGESDSEDVPDGREDVEDIEDIDFDEQHQQNRESFEDSGFYEESAFPMMSAPEAPLEDAELIERTVKRIQVPQNPADSEEIEENPTEKSAEQMKMEMMAELEKNRDESVAFSPMLATICPRTSRKCAARAFFNVLELAKSRTIAPPVQLVPYGEILLSMSSLSTSDH